MHIVNDSITIKVGGLTFTSSRKSTTSPQYVLSPEAITGWYDGTSVKRTSTVRPNSWGDFSEPGYRNSRLMTVTGTAIAADSYQLHSMRDAFMSILNSGGYEEMSLQNSSGTRYANVALEGTPSWVQQLDNVAFWKIELYSPDPRIYGEKLIRTIGATSSVGGGQKYLLTYPLNYNTDQTNVTQTITNLGNADAWPIFTVTGTYPSGFVLTDNQDHKVTYNGQVTVQAPITIDMGKGTATQSGVDKTNLVSDRGWFSVSPSEIVRPTFSPIDYGPGWCDIIIRDTWI